MFRTVICACIAMLIATSPARSDWRGSAYPQANGMFTAVVTDLSNAKSEIIGTFATEREAKRAAQDAERRKTLEENGTAGCGRVDCADQGS